MTKLDERLREATDALGDGPRVAPTFDVLRRRHRARRRRSALTAAVAIVVICGAVAFAVRGTRTRSTNPVAPTTGRVAPTTSVAGTSTSTPVRPLPGVQPLADMPRFPASAVHTVALSPDVGADRAVFTNGELWFIGGNRGCKGASCPWLFHANPSTGAVAAAKTPPLPTQGAGPIAVGDGGAFVVVFDYDGTPLRVMGIDLATGAARFDVPIAGTSVQGNPKARLAFGDGAVWVSMGAMPVVELNPSNGAVLATIPLPGNGAETNGEVLTPVDRFGLWVVGGATGTGVFLVDPSKRRAESVVDFGEGFSQSLAADDTNVWTTHFAGRPDRLDLARISLADPTHPTTAGIPTPQVAVGDGQVWFLGYEPGLQAADPANHYGAVGRIDPTTLKVIGVAELPGVSDADDLQLFVADGSAWVFHYAAGTITRITPPNS